MRTTKVIRCSCKHAEQDEMYGDGNRLANQTSSTKYGQWRCTICAKESK